MLNDLEKRWLESRGGRNASDVFMDEQGQKFVIMGSRLGPKRVYIPSPYVLKQMFPIGKGPEWEIHLRYETEPIEPVPQKRPNPREYLFRNSKSWALWSRTHKRLEFDKQKRHGAKASTAVINR